LTASFSSTSASVIALSGECRVPPGIIVAPSPSLMESTLPLVRGVCMGRVRWDFRRCIFGAVYRSLSALPAQKGTLCL
jgi:hypothetical protein